MSSSDERGERPLCLVTGATGYLGGRLVPALLADGYRVRCLVRDPDKLSGVPWAGQVELVTGDVLDPGSMRAACAGVDTFYYLVHSLTVRGFASVDRRAALVTAEAAREAGVRRIVYLGGLHPDSGDGELSEHLGSRAEVGEIFLRSGVPSVVLQAAVIIGSGSASFEMLRYLTERLPVMVTPTWVRSRVQPIAVRDVLHYLVAAPTLPAGVNRSFDIGGPDVLSYREMMQRYAAVAGLPRRRMLPVGLLTPKLSSHWLNIVTPVPRSVGAPLIGSLVHDAVRGEHDIDALVAPPEGGLIGYERSVQLALASITRGERAPRWGRTSPELPSDPLPSDPDWSGGTAYVDVRDRCTSASRTGLWRAVEGVGATRGWPVESVDEGRTRRLRPRLRMPGRAWLELGVRQRDPAGQDGPGAVYHQRAIFVPRGLAGHLYWWAGASLRGVVLGGLARSVVRHAEGERDAGGVRARDGADRSAAR
jgi:uncharacterized protein YbjT (DUF2867 family)